MVHEDTKRRVLEFLNSATAQDIVEHVIDDPLHGNPRGRGISMSVAHRIVSTRTRLPTKKFTSIQQLEAIKGLGSDTLHDILYSLGAYDEDPSPPVPAGCIMMWKGVPTRVPKGWALCDGSQGTPDLRGRFIVGAHEQLAPGTTGGADHVKLAPEELPSHTHGYGDTFRSEVDGWVSVPDGRGSGEPATYNNKGMEFSRKTAATGGNQAHENRPPFHALVFIMKL